MKLKFNTPRCEGYFDVRTFNATKPREQWAIKGENESISFVVSLADSWAWAGEYVKKYTTKEGQDRQLVRIKVGAQCRWYNEQKKQMKKPTNTELDGKRYEAFIIGVDLGKDNGAMKANGIWANAILLRPMLFADDWDNIEFSPAPQAQAQAQAPQAQAQAPQAQAPQGELPF